jgi:hypothetical protein
MESPKHQEWRARQRLSGRAICQAALFAGAVLFVFSGGSPWTTPGIGNVIGRELPASFLPLLILHFVLSFIYSWAIASVIYRMRLGAGVVMGVVTGLGLYVLNYGFFHTLSTQLTGPEFRALIVHVVFSLMSSLVYKAAAVPPPLRGDREQVLRREHELGWSNNNVHDPEPEPVAATAGGRA